MKNSMICAFNRIILMVVFCLTGLTCVQAQDFFDGTTGNRLWSDAANWRDGQLPTEHSLGVIICSDVVVDMDVTIPGLADEVMCNLIVQEGKKLVVETGIYWDNGGDFILEDGAQLVHDGWNQNGVQILALKRIQARSDNHLWNLIASPVMEDITPSIENGFLTESETGYALFAYDALHQNWVNYKDSPFVLTNGNAYLYANALDTVLQFRGTARESFSATEIGLAYHPESGNLAGCNFVGNPLLCNAVVSRSYYVFDEESNYIRPVAHSSDRTVAPCNGIIVEAKEENDAVAFYYGGPYLHPNADYLEISVAKSNAPNTILDQALFSFNPDDRLAKYQFFENAPQVYFTDEGQDLAILGVDSVDVQPLKFKAMENASYTLHFELNDLEVEFLQLIDNQTGSKTDLLATPDYTFSASSNDYPSRFKLVFDPHFGVGENEGVPFAYMSNGSIIINPDGIQGFASLQVVDMTGRVVRIYDGDAISRVSIEGLTKGVYVLQLSADDGVRTQKIAVF